MVSIPGLYFVIAGNDRARFVRPDPRDRLHTVGSADLATLRQNDTDTTDPCGPRSLEESRFLPLLARRINDDLAVDLFTHLVLVAPPAVLRELMGLFDPPTATSLIGTLPRDLMAVPDLELRPHLLSWMEHTNEGCTPSVRS